LDFLTT